MLIPGNGCRNSGFSLIELMIALSIAAVALALGIPAVGTWMQNTQVRTVAESISDGLTKAKNAALNNPNAVVEFALNADTSWKITLKLTGGAETIIEQRAMYEGSSSNVTATVVPAGASKVTFNSLGQASPSLVQVNVASAKGTKKLRVDVIRGGLIKMCDPDAPAGDPRYCVL